jgi:hypothetical protein
VLLEIPTEIPSTAEHQHPLQYLATLLGGRQCAAGEVLRQCAKNLFDKEYVSGCNDAGRCYWGDSRTLLGTVSYNW